MPAGTSAYMGLAVPLYGESEIQQRTAGNDIITLTQITASTGDFWVARDNSGTERAFLSDPGLLTLGIGAAAGAGGITLPGNSYIKFSVPLTTRPTTGLDKGDLMVLFHGSKPKIGVCSSSATNAIKLITLRTKTFGRLSTTSTA